MRNACTNPKTLRRLSRLAGFDVSYALTRGNTDHRFDVVRASDGKVFHLQVLYDLGEGPVWGVESAHPDIGIDIPAATIVIPAKGEHSGRCDVRRESFFAYLRRMLSTILRR